MAKKPKQADSTRPDQKKDKIGKKPKPADPPILAAIDFSPASEKVLVWAAHTAQGLGVPLVALHVVHGPESAPDYYRQSKKKRKKQLKRIEEAAAEAMSEFLERLRKKHPKLLDKLDRHLVAGIPVTRILEVAEKIGAQLIVMGSRGRTGLSHLLLGSKTEKVVQLSRIPVTIVKNSKKRE